MTTITKFEEQKQEIDFYKSLASTAAKSGNYAGMNEMSLEEYSHCLPCEGEADE